MTESKHKFIIPLLLFLVFTISGCKVDESSVEPEEVIPKAAMIYLDQQQQLIRGFGGVNMPGWIPDMTTDQVNKAFGTGTGQIGLSILRIRVSYDSNEFGLEVPTAQKAISLGATVIASPWTPPAWMKSSNNIVGGILNANNYQNYAAHLKSFVNYMNGFGVPIYAVSIQNEPDVNVTYESCSWNYLQMLKFMQDNAPSIGTKIIMPEVSDFNRTISDAVLSDQAASNNVSIVGGHIYGGGIAPYPLAVLKGKEVWMTEHLSLDTTWTGAFNTGLEIYDCMNAGMNAYIWWYIRRFYGPIDDNSNVTKRGYVMSQYARFIRPGYYKVNASPNPQDYIYVTAYKSGSKIIIVAINNDSNSAVSQQFILKNVTANSFTPYTTTKTKNCVPGNNIISSGGKFTYTLEKQSITTFVSN